MAASQISWWRNRNPSNSSSNKSGVYPLIETHRSPKVKGQFITFADGSKFRRTTTHQVSRIQMIPQGSENSNYWGVRYYNYTSSPGGNLSNARSANWSLRLDANMGIPSINGYPRFEDMERNEAITKCLNTLADNKAQIGENLATLGQTVRLFANPTRSIISALRKFHAERDLFPFLRRSYRDIVRGGVSKKVADKYLEYVYGVVPLMSDLYGIAELAKEAGRLPPLLHASESATRSLSCPDQEYSNVSAYQMEYWKGITGKSRTRCTLWARVSDKYQGTRTLNQLGLVNPASLVWELVPYSFLVDWVLPIGPVLQALTAPAGLDFVNGSVSRKVSANWQWLFGGAAQGTPYTGTLASGQMRYDGYTRYELTSWPRPGLWYDADPLRLSSDGSDRVFKALALGIARLPRF